MKLVKKLPLNTLLLTAIAPMAVCGAEDKQSESLRGVLEEIVVVAQKRKQSLQDVPVAITAVNSEAIENNFIVDLTNLGYMAPNVQLQAVSTFPGFANFTIRGIGVSTSIRTLDPAVNIIQDGMVFATQIGAVVDVFDVESVEILRGPQGIFFGRNTTGGAVLMRTAKPSEEFQGRFKLGAGTANLFTAEGIVEGALSDTVRAKLAIQHRQQDGLFEDNNGGTFEVATFNPSGLQPDNPQKDQAERDSILIKPTITFQPSDDLDITLFAQYYKDDGGGASTRMFVDPDAPSAAESLFGYTPPSDPYEINHDLVGVSETESWHTIVETNWDVGAGTLTSVTSFRDLTFDSSLDVDGTPFLLIHFPDNEESADQFTQELRFASSIGDNLDLLAGVFYMTSEMSVTERRMFSGLAVGRAHTDYAFIQSDWTQEQTSKAIFANVNYSINDDLSVSAGVRYTQEDKELDIIPLGLCSGDGFNGCPEAVLNLDDDWSNTSPRASIEYKLNEDVMTYVTWTRGFRSGNFNARANSVATISATEPEQADQFELGLKGEFLDRSLRTNIAAFYTEYDDIQRITNEADSGGAPLQKLRNAASATISGLELDFIWVATQHLSFDGGLGFLDAEFDEFAGFSDAEAKNLEFDRVPEKTATIGTNLSFGVGEGDLTFRVQMAYRDGFFTDVNNTPNLAQSSYKLWDASARYETESLRIALYGKNIDDESFADINSPALNLQRFGGQPRTYGVEVGYKF